MRRSLFQTPLVILDSLLALQSAAALTEGVAFSSYVKEWLTSRPATYTPFLSVIAPCKGIDPGLDQNLAAVLEQDYPDFEVIFVIATSSDPARPVIEQAIEQHPSAKARLVVAGHSSGRSEKVHNLINAVEAASPNSEAFVFFDSDARPHRTWLLELAAPLSDSQIGAATGYRWYLPARSGFWPALLSGWNATVATTLGNHGRNFVWGGSTAIKREVFDKIGVRELWEKAASDDYATTTAVQRSGLRIQFVPTCLLVTLEDCSFGSLLEFTTRQIIITRVYRPNAWWVGMLSYSLFNVGFWGSILAILLAAFGIAGAGLGTPLLIAGALTLFVYILGSLKGVTRLASALRLLPSFRSQIRRLWWVYCLAWPIVSVLFWYNFIKSATTRRIRWRGVHYELKSPTETVILNSD